MASERRSPKALRPWSASEEGRSEACVTVTGRVCPEVGSGRWEGVGQFQAGSSRLAVGTGQAVRRDPLPDILFLLLRPANTSVDAHPSSSSLPPSSSTCGRPATERALSSRNSLFSRLPLFSPWPQAVFAVLRPMVPLGVLSPQLSRRRSMRRPDTHNVTPTTHIWLRRGEGAAAAAADRSLSSTSSRPPSYRVPIPKLAHARRPRQRHT